MKIEEIHQITSKDWILHTMNKKNFHIIYCNTIIASYHTINMMNSTKLSVKMAIPPFIESNNRQSEQFQP
jgi:hypothetical protein